MPNTPESLENRSIQVPEMIFESDVVQVAVSDILVKQILELNTPDEILARGDFPSPTIIGPKTVRDGLDLLEKRERIRKLELVPEKTQEMYDKYHGYTKREDIEGRRTREKELAKKVEEYFAHTENFAFVRNMYPYNLPPGVEQYITWMKEMGTSRRDTAEFIAKCVQKLNIPNENLIIFERSLKTIVDRVRGSFPIYRHVHVWWVKR